MSAFEPGIDTDQLHIEEASLSQKIATFIGVLLPFASLFVAIPVFWNRGVSAVDVALLIGMYGVSGLGITFGFHRLFAHGAFQTIAPVRALIGIMGSMAAQGPVLTWTAVHRQHHQYSDSKNDPHSPHGFGTGVWSVLAGFWHAHVGWLFKHEVPNYNRYVPDLMSDPLMRWVDRYFGLWVILGFIVPATIGGLISQSWYGAATGLLWGGFVRLFVGHHLTWSVNSVCHLWGARHFRSRDESRNNAIFGILALGEGWHNNHHAFPTSARHGLLWWQFDITYVVIRALERVGLIWRVRLPSQEALAERRILPESAKRPAAAIAKEDSVVVSATPAVSGMSR